MAGGLFGNLIEEAILNRKKPKVPGAPNVNPQQAQRTSVAGNASALPELEDLAGDVNGFNVGQRQSMLEKAIPGYKRLAGSESDLIGGWLHGQLSPDVASAVRRNSNVRAQSGGYGGSGMADNLEARDLGLTSLDLQKAGSAALPGWLGTETAIGVPHQFDPAADFITPGQQIGAEQWNENNRFSRDWLNNQLKVQPSAFMSALAGTVGNVADPTSGALSLVGDVYGGSKGGGGGNISNLGAGYEAMNGGPAYGAGAGAAASGGGY